jgi:transposase
MNRQAVAERFGISLSSTNRWVQRAAATGSAAALPMGGKKPFSLAEQAEWINARIAEKPDITGRELLAELHERHVEVSYYAVWNFLDRTGPTSKKSPHASEQDRRDVARRREIWKRLQGKVDVSRLIFIDETGAKTEKTRLHGRCAVAQRLVAKVPHGHWKTLTFVAGRRCDGAIAPYVFDRPMNAVSFLAWVTNFLVPNLRRSDVVVMDNLSSHKAPVVRRAIRSAGALLIFLPPYSPDLNPIEQAFSTLKTLLRKENARTREQTETCIGMLLDRITAEECANYFREGGYLT